MTPEGGLKVFSRSLLNTSEKFPEVPLYVQESCKDTNVTSFVLDTEVVAFNRETKQFVPFQVLSTRKRTEENAESAKVQVIVQAFDLMYLNGVSLLDRPLAERRDLLHKNFLLNIGFYSNNIIIVFDHLWCFLCSLLYWVCF